MRGAGGRQGELARESKRNESERRGSEKARGMRNGGDCFVRECATREGDERE